MYPPFLIHKGCRRRNGINSFSDLYSMLSKVEINLPLLEVISNVPAYTKFFKELCSKKKKLLGPEKLFATEVANSVLQQSLPPKLKDPGSFNINITIGNKKQVKAMLDLGASINLMPYSLYISSWNLEN